MNWTEDAENPREVSNWKRNGVPIAPNQSIRPSVVTFWLALVLAFVSGLRGKFGTVVMSREDQFPRTLKPARVPVEQRSMKKRIALTGMMGSGKTAVAMELSKLFKLPAIDLHERICAHEQSTIAEIFAKGGEQLFRSARF